MPGVSCVIVISGLLDDRYDRAFGGLTMRATEPTTELRGKLVDQSELQGVLRQLFDLGLEVVSVTATTDSPSSHCYETPDTVPNTSNHERLA